LSKLHFNIIHLYVSKSLSGTLALWFKTKLLYNFIHYHAHCASDSTQPH
jgi:hypothetical protein